MSKIYSAIHYLVILSVLLLGIASTHLCLEKNSNSEAEISYLSDSSHNETPASISFDCGQSSCHHNCNHLFNTNDQFVSKFLNLDTKTLNILEDAPLFSKYSSLPSKPPKA